MKSLQRNLIAVLMVLSTVLPACSSGGGSGTDINAEDLATESIFSDTSGYPYLAQVLGDMTQQDLWNFATIAVENLAAAANAGEATEADAQAIKTIISTLYEWMGSSEITSAVDDLAHGPLVELLDLIVSNNVGSFITALISNAGSDVLTTNIYPMLAYLVSLDTSTLATAVSGINISDFGLDTSSIDQEDFEAASAALNGIFTMAQENGKYHDIYTDLMALYNSVKTNDNISTFTVGDLINLTPGIPLIDLEIGNIGLYVDVFNVLTELLNEDDQILEDVSTLLHAAGYLMATGKTSDGFNTWDSNSMTDLERVLLCLRDGLAPDSTTASTRTNLYNLIYNVLNGVEYLNGADNIYGLTNALTAIDPDTDYINDLKGIDNALYQQMMQMNIYGEATANSTVRASELQSVLVMVDGFWGVSEAIRSMGLTSLITSLIKWDSSGPTISRKSDLAEWLVGALVEPMYGYPTSYQSAYMLDSSSSDSLERPYPDPLKGLDWLMYDENITVLYFLTFSNGLDQIINLGAIDVFDYLLDAVDASGISNTVFGGNMTCLTESLEAVAPLIGATGSKYTTGNHHRLMTLAAPVLQYYYELGYASELVHFISDLNEVNIKTYKSLASGGTSATYRLDSRGTSLEQLMGPYGHGMVYYLLRGQSDATGNHIEDILDPALDLMVRVLYKLRNTSYEGSNMLEAVCNDLIDRTEDLSEQTGMSVEDLVEALFADNGPIDQLYSFLDTNHSQIAQICASLGNVVMGAVNQTDTSKNILYTDDIIGLIQDILQGNNDQPDLGTVLKENSVAISQVAANLLTQAGIGDAQLIANTQAFIETACSHGVDICTDLGSAIPVIVDLIGAVNIDGDYDFSLDDLEPILEYLTADVDGQENPLVYNIKAIAYKVAGIYDATYNPKGTMQLSESTALVDLANHLIGDNGLYDINPLLDFLGDLTANDAELLISWLEIGQDAAGETIIDAINDLISSDGGITISTNFIKSLFVSYNDNDSLVLAVLKLVNLEYQGEMIDFNGVINDISKFIKKTEFKAGSDSPVFDLIYDVLGILINSYNI